MKRTKINNKEAVVGTFFIVKFTSREKHIESVLNADRPKRRGRYASYLHIDKAKARSSV